MSLTENERKLIHACYTGNVEKVKELLTSKTNINCQQENGYTPLLFASQQNHVEVVKLLLSSGAKVDLANNSGSTPIWIASFYGNKDVVQILLKGGANVDQADKTGAPPLYIAAHKNCIQVVELLLTAGANVDLAVKDKITPLFIASSNNHSDVVKLLLAAGAQVNLATSKGTTPLAVASYKGNTSVVKLLLKAGAKSDIQDQSGNTALHSACFSGHDDAVEALISAHADITLKNKDGKCPLDLAKTHGHSKIVDMLQRAVLNLVSKVKEIPLADIQLGRLLGRGTYGAVYQGTWKSNQGKRIAVKKILHTPGTNMPEDVTTLQTLPQHPHIITYYGVAQSEDAVYIVTEFAPNGSLYDHLYEKNQMPTFEQSHDWAWQIAHGMEHLHEHNIIHRDLKSANILLCIGNVAKIADFGTARYLHGTTQQTDVRGTYPWMSPEVMEEVEARVNKRCDSYSYGMLLYELFEHKTPFHDKSKFLIPSLVLAGERPTITCSLPPYLEQLILACWKPNSHERPTFAAIAIALETNIFE